MSRGLQGRPVRVDKRGSRWSVQGVSAGPDLPMDIRLTIRTPLGNDSEERLSCPSSNSVDPATRGRLSIVDSVNPTRTSLPKSVRSNVSPGLGKPNVGPAGVGVERGGKPCST